MALVDENYRDSGSLREQDRVCVEDFLADEDRAQVTGRGVPFFSGREAEIGVFRRVVNALSRGRRGNATVVVEGPPGAGKSALMCQFMEEMLSLPPTEAERRRWLPVPLSASAAESPPNIADAIDEAIVGQLAGALLATGDRPPKPRETASLVSQLSEYWGGDINAARARAKAKTFFDRGASIMGFSLGASREGPPRSVSEAAARRRAAWQSWQIVLMIDEAQGLVAGEPHTGEGTLSALHQGIVRAPVSFCAFGLPGTLAALADVGVSRPSGGRTIHLGGLDDGAARQMVNRCFTSFGVENEAPWREAILERAANWPQHLAFYLNSAVRQIVARSPDHRDAGRADLALAMREGDRGRARYYGQRMVRIRRRHGGFEKLARELVPLLRERGGRLPYSDLFDLVEEIGARASLLSGTNATEFIRDAEHGGLLASSDDGETYAMPIPSFAGHLLGELLPDLGPSAAAAKSTVASPSGNSSV